MLVEKYKRILSVIAVAGLLHCSLTSAAEVVLPGTQIAQGKGTVVAYYSHGNQKLNIQVSGRDEIKVPGISQGYFSNVTNDLESTGDNSTAALKLLINPWSGFYYWANIGIGLYDLSIPSSSVTNKLSSRDNGIIAGLGIRSVLFPDTIVTPSVAIEAGLNYSVYNLSEFQSGVCAEQLIDNRLELTEIQASVIVSKVIDRIEPYGGLRIFRTITSLTDKQSTGSVSGIKDNAGIFAGIKVKVYPHEAIVLEGNFIGQSSFVVGWNVDF